MAARVWSRVAKRASRCSSSNCHQGQLPRHSVPVGYATHRRVRSSNARAPMPQTVNDFRPQRGHKTTQTTSIAPARSKVNRRLDKHGNLTWNSWRKCRFRGVVLRERTNWIGSAGGWIFASVRMAASHTTVNCLRLREYFDKNGDSAGIGLIASVFSANWTFLGFTARQTRAILARLARIIHGLTPTRSVSEDWVRVVLAYASGWCGDCAPRMPDRE